MAVLFHVSAVKCNEWGTPLVSDLFAQAEQLGSGSVVCYVNADIILFDNFADAISRVAVWRERFLMPAQKR